MQLVLNAWGDDLNSRPEDRKRSIKGKLASATHMQTVSYIKPLFRKLKRRVGGQLSLVMFVAVSALVLAGKVVAAHKTVERDITVVPAVTKLFLAASKILPEAICFTTGSSSFFCSQPSNV